MDVKKIIIIFAILLMIGGGTISVLKWLQIGPFSNKVEEEKITQVEPPIDIKMDKLSIPIFAEDRVAATILIELKVQVLGVENQQALIKQLPRLTDAFFKELYVFVPQLIRRKTKLTTSILTTRMQKAAKKVLSPGLLHKIVMLKVTDK